MRVILNVMWYRVLLFVALCLSSVPAYGQQPEIEVPDIVLSGKPFEVTIRFEGQQSDTLAASAYSVIVGEQVVAPVAGEEEGTLVVREAVASKMGRVEVELRQGDQPVARSATRSIPGWMSILPPVLAIVIALIFKRVIPALFLGIWIGAWIASGLTLFGLWDGLLDTLQVYVLNSLADQDHAAILIFSLMIGGMVGIISKNGGTRGVVNYIVNWANNAVKGQVAAGLLGLAIFFDDYANSLVVGNTMRPITDRLRVSREKLAYIVDSTAAPVAALALVTTWIGYEVGLVGSAVAQIPDFNESAYFIFLNSIPYSFYPILSLFFVFTVAFSMRDFGPMAQAELRTRTTGQVMRPDAKVDEALSEGKELEVKAGKPQRVINAVLPVLVMVVTVLTGLYVTGEGETLREIIGSSDSYKALMWASLLSVLTAGVMSVSQGILTIDETVEAWYSGLKSMLFAMIILLMAWALSSITEVLHTADYLISILSESLHPGIVPALVFLIAAATSFATGSSWGTMGILMPLVIPLAWATLNADGPHNPADYHHIIYSTVSAVLAGSVWGDHCSPISDTTILSSMASGCDHIDHVRTQLPYAFLVGVVAVLVGSIPTGFGFPWWASMLIGAAVLFAALRFFGERIEEPAQIEPSPVRESA